MIRKEIQEKQENQERINMLEKKVYIMWAELIVLMFILVALFIIDSTMGSVWRNEDNKARAEAWTTIKSTQSRILSEIGKNYERITINDNRLIMCTNCHSHHPSTELKSFPKQDKK
jgi:hypothetical protein